MDSNSPVAEGSHDRENKTVCDYLCDTLVVFGIVGLSYTMGKIDAYHEESALYNERAQIARQKTLDILEAQLKKEVDERTEKSAN
jgi:hypothetical protein